MKTTILVGCLFGIARVWIGFHVEPEHFAWIQAYKDAAHLFMGGLFVSAWIKGHRWQWWLFWLLNAVEVAVAVYSRM